MPERGLTRRDLYSAIIFAALLYLAARFISGIVDVLLVFSVTILIVTILDPMVSWLERRRVPRPVSAAVLAVGAIGLLMLVLYLVIPPAVGQLQDLTRQLPGWVETVQERAEAVVRQYPALERVVPSESAIDPQTVQEFATSIIGGASTITASALGVVAAALLVFILTIYALSNPAPLVAGVLRAVRPAQRPAVLAAGRRLGAQVRAWGVGVLVGMLAIFALTWIALTILGVKQAFLFAVIAGLLEAVPIIGPVVAAIPPVLVSLLQTPVLAIWVALAFLLIQQVESNILVPMIMSRQLSLHPVTVIFAVLVMGGLFGIIGIFLAVPAVALFGVLYDELYICRRDGNCAHSWETSDERPEDADST